MKIYLIRHGEIPSNVLRTYNNKNEDLTENGISQAEALKHKIDDINYDIIIASPLTRAIHTAGIINIKNKEIITDTLERIRKVIDTNIFATIAMIKSVVPIMKKQGFGQIININSQSGVMCEPLFPIYNATKQSTYAFRKAIQDDLTRNNIKITDICPGLVQTYFYERANNALSEEIMVKGLTAEDVAKTVQYIFELPHEITIPSIEIRHIDNY